MFFLGECFFQCWFLIFLLFSIGMSRIILNVLMSSSLLKLYNDLNLLSRLCSQLEFAKIDPLDRVCVCLIVDLLS